MQIDLTVELEGRIHQKFCTVRCNFHTSMEIEGPIQRLHLQPTEDNGYRTLTNQRHSLKILHVSDLVVGTTTNVY